MTNINYKEVGNRLKRLIAEKNMNQIEFAKLCNVSEATLRLHIRGEIKKGINCDCLYAYSRELNVSMEYLLTGVETKKPIAIKYVDIINAINLLIDAFGTEIISPCSEEFADCLYIADEAIQTYLEKSGLTDIFAKILKESTRVKHTTKCVESGQDYLATDIVTLQRRSSPTMTMTTTCPSKSKGFRLQTDEGLFVFLAICGEVWYGGE